MVPTTPLDTYDVPILSLLCSYCVPIISLLCPYQCPDISILLFSYFPCYFPIAPYCSLLLPIAVPIIFRKPSASRLLFLFFPYYKCSYYFPTKMFLWFPLYPQYVPYCFNIFWLCSHYVSYYHSPIVPFLCPYYFPYSFPSYSPLCPYYFPFTTGLSSLVFPY